jgi:rubrerythrin
MNIEALITTTLASVTVAALSSCPSTWNCHPPEVPFVYQEAALTEQDVRELVSDFGLESRASIDCETACRTVLRRQYPGGGEREMASCQHEIAADPGATPGAVVGRVSCAGDAFEWLCEGRRPIGHVELEGDAGGVGDYLARCAHLEEAAVIAFETLGGRLEGWGAPDALVRRCRVAAADERRHARLVTALARARGAEPPTAMVLLASPTRVEVAIDNAVEGCVHEAWAAVQARHLASHALDPEVARTYGEIAVDESRHAQLAWDLHAWFEHQLTPHEVERVRAAMETAISALNSLRVPQPLAALGGLSGASSRIAASRFAEGLRASA